MLAYPGEARQSLDKLYALWFDHLCENIPSVRAGAAAAVANAVRAYGEEALLAVLPQLRWAHPHRALCHAKLPSLSGEGQVLAKQ